jgi:hypothetical protein
MTKINIGVIKNGIVTLGICAGLTVGSLGLATHAEARVPDGPRVDWEDEFCGNVQDDFDQGQRDMAAASTPADKAKAQGEISDAIDKWYRNNCDADYGAISVMRLGGDSGYNQVSGVRGKSVDHSGPAAAAPVHNAGQ